MEPMVKGYAIQAAIQFILDNPDLKARVPPALVQSITRAQGTFKPTAWYPRSEAMRLYEAIAGAAPNEAEAYALLKRCGESAAAAAIQGYLKLLLKVLTPKMFAGKFADFWTRDHQSGHAEVSLPEEKRFIFHLKDVGGFTHIGPIVAGFIAHAMEAIGVKDIDVKCTPWSMAVPDANDLNIEVRWR